jgi:hypothetical protein
MNPFSFLPLPDYQAAVAVKLVLATFGAAMLAWIWRAMSRSRPALGGRRASALALAGCLAAGAWWNYGGFHFAGGFIHYHEFFHYFLGAKYFPEVGYTGLYDCVVAAEVESGHTAEVSARWVRDLTTNALGTNSPALDDPAVCTSHFSPARWRAFRRDLEWFRAHVTAAKWEELTTDHGFNATPVWTIAGTLLANTGPATTWRIRALALIDPLLIGLTAAAFAWAFGWPALCVAAIWWGTNYPARYTFIGGAYLREDWLLATVLAICLARRGRWGLSGFALGVATLLRVFPGFLALGLLLKAGIDSWDSRALRISPALRRFATGAVLAVLLLVPLSLWIVQRPEGGIASWRGFVENSRKHLSTPLTNNVGLPMAITWDSSTRSDVLGGFWLDSPWDSWKEARAQRFAERRWAYWLMVAGFVALLGLAVRRQPEWVALVLGIGLLPYLTSLTCYYYSILLLFAAFWPRLPAAGVGLAATAALTCLTPAVLGTDDDRYMAIGVLILLYVSVTTAWLASARSPVFAAMSEAEAQDPAASTVVSSRAAPGAVVR